MAGGILDIADQCSFLYRKVFCVLEGLLFWPVSQGQSGLGLLAEMLLMANYVLFVLQMRCVSTSEVPCSVGSLDFVALVVQKRKYSVNK